MKRQILVLGSHQGFQMMHLQAHRMSPYICSISKSDIL